MTVTAFDADGNPVPVTITPGSGMTVSGNTVTGDLTNTSPTTEQGSALFEIAGPVAQIVVDYDNGGDTQQAVYFSDVHFDSVPIGSDDDVIEAGGGDDVVFAGDGDDSVDGGSGADTLHGGAGADTLDGGTGDDTIHVGEGDVAGGGDGDDIFIIDPAELDGGTLTIVGVEGAEGVGDTLDFNGQLVNGSIVYSNTDDDAGGLSGWPLCWTGLSSPSRRSRRSSVFAMMR